MANKINNTTTYPNTTPAAGDHVIGTDVSDTANDVNGEVVTFTMQAIMDFIEANGAAPASFISSGTFADARIAQTSLTQYDTLFADTADQLTAGFSAAIHDLGTPAASATVTLDDANGNYQKLTNDDNFTLEPPALASGEATNILVHVTNSATTPGTITFGATNGGFETPTGDTVPTAADAVFFLHITCSDNGTAQKNTVVVKAMA